VITTFLFDLGGVLFTNGTKKFIRQIRETYNLPEEQVKGVIDGEIGSLYRESKITRDEFWKRVIERLGLKEDADTLEKQWIDGYEMFEKTKSIIEKLKDKYDLYYLSDNVKERVEALDNKFAFIKLFKGGIFSHEVGVRKPNPRIYEYALEKASSKPEETIFIDDKEKMLLPAQQMGLKTILFISPEELEEILLKDGLI